MKTIFVDVVLPLHLPDTYTYRVPQEYNEHIRVGQRVVVQFGKKRLYSALVRTIHENAPHYQVKYILSILDVEPMVNETQFRFWSWLAEYYMCYLGDVMAAALPSAFKLASESTISIHPDFDGELDSLSENEMRIVKLLLEHPVLTSDDISKALGIQKIMPILNGMVERSIIITNEELHERYRPRTATFLSLGEKYVNDEQAQKELFDSLEKKSATQKQLDVLLKFMQLSHFGKEKIQKKTLQESGVSMSSLNTLLKNGVFTAKEEAIDRITEYSQDQMVSPESIQLNEEQQAAYKYISQQIANTQEGKKVTLLHGVTSSGKTEVYIKLINDTIRKGKQVLFLLPEIALTAQLINRLQAYFGNSIGVYHSRFSTSQRAEVWTRTMSDNPSKRFNILIGARSALFLPFVNLGLVIIDEEHDSSFKQYDPIPRYNGRDSAIVLAQMWGATTVLGSATPSVESYFNATSGKYGFVEMKQRYGGIQLPEILCVDMKDATRKREVSSHFSSFLLQHIREALETDNQVILFQNRRGFSLRIECDDCGYVPQCEHCDVSLVYHKETHSLRCHYCGYSIPVPSECPACHSTHLSMKGFGTERIEEDLSIHFPKAKIARMDLDSTLQRNRYVEILNDFEDHKIDILVGTQMVTKGLDFSRVSVVGILSADNLISFPDFRSFERAFQQMTQVSGRAGRHGSRGKVIIQAYNPWHQAIRNVMDNDYADMFRNQIVERRVFRYPPYYRLIDITLRHRDKDRLDDAAATFAALLQGTFGNRVVGPEYPNVPRIRGLYLKKIMLRFEKSEAIKDAKHIIADMAHEIEKRHSTIQISFDVDPQ